MPTAEKASPPPLPAEDVAACFTIEDMNAMVEDYEGRMEEIERRLKDAEERAARAEKDAMIVEERRRNEEALRVASEDKLLDALDRFRKIEREFEGLRTVLNELAFAPHTDMVEPAEITGAHAVQTKETARQVAATDAMLAATPASAHGQPGARFDFGNSASAVHQIAGAVATAARADASPRRRRMSAFGR